MNNFDLYKFKIAPLIVCIFKELSSEEPSRIEKTRGSVEIVEVSVTEDEESEKELNKSQIEDIVHSSKPSISNQDSQPPDEVVETTENGEEKSNLEIKLELSEGDTEETSKTEPSEEETTTTNWTTTTESKECAPIIEETSEFSSDTTSEIKKELNINTDGEQQTSEPTIIKSELSENLFSEINIEIKVDNTIGVKRDYSRTKKKEDKGKFIFIQTLLYSEVVKSSFLFLNFQHFSNMNEEVL